MNSNSLSSTAVFTPMVDQNKMIKLTAINYWKLTLIILLALILGGFVLQMISGAAVLILSGSIVFALALKPIIEILEMDFDLSNLEINDIHEELWK